MKTKLSIAILSALACTTASAEVKVNGFANIVGGLTSSDDQVYGYDDRVSFSEGSLFAIQVIGDINDKMTATGQIVARGANDYDPDFEWAYLTYRPNDKLSISAGRLRLPLFNYSSSSDIGYSYHWIEAPQAVYAVPFNNLDGLSLNYASFAGDWEYNLSASVGTYEGETDSTPTTGENVFLLSAEAIYDIFKIRLVTGASKTSFPFDQSGNPGFVAAGQALDALAAAGFANLADGLRLEDDTGTFTGLSLQLDNFNWFVSGEYTEVDVEDAFSSTDIAYYVTAGIRTGKWTPSITYERAEGEITTRFDAQIQALADLSPQLAGFASGLVNSVGEDVDVWSATLRYDYDTNIALKVDLTRHSDDILGNDVTLLRFGANYVF